MSEYPLLYLVSDYGATGEGRTISILITYAFPLSHDYATQPSWDNGTYHKGTLKNTSEERAKREFIEKFDEWFAIGAEVIVRTGEHAQYRLVQPSRSYFSANELIQTFGLGAWSEPVDVEVVWPSGASQSYVVKTSNRVVTLRESEVSDAQIELD